MNRTPSYHIIKAGKPIVENSTIHLPQPDSRITETDEHLTQEVPQIIRLTRAEETRVVLEITCKCGEIIIVDCIHQVNSMSDVDSEQQLL